MKKLLLLGNNLHVDTLINIASDRGIYTIVTDNLSVDDSPVKRMADEAWDISVTDIDTLEIEARKAHIDAVLCGASEICMKANRELCKRLGLPFCVSDKAWNIVNNKRLFKEECRKFNVPVSKDYKLDINFDEEDLKKIEYPVVVKPVDGCSSIGLHICYTKEQLIDGFTDAYEKSDIREVVVEKYYAGEEVSFLFFFNNGEPIVIETSEVLGDKKNGRPFIFGGTPTKHIKIIDQLLEVSLKNLFNEMECQDGVGSIQLVKDGDDIAVIEMNYRLPGAKTMSNVFICERIMDYAFNEQVDYNAVMKLIPKQFNTTAYCIWLKAGKIGRIKGIDELERKLNLFSFTVNHKEGDIIIPNSGMRQIFAYIVMDGSKENIIDASEYINNNLEVLDVEGNDMVYRYAYDNKGNASLL